MDNYLLDDGLADDDSIAVDVLCVGLTRPATLGGVSMKPLLLAFFGLALVFLGTGNPFYLLIGVPEYIILRWISADYPRIFNEIAAWVRVNGRCRNREFWGVASFSPRTTDKWGKDYGFAC